MAPPAQRFALSEKACPLYEAISSTLATRSVRPSGGSSVATRRAWERRVGGPPLGPEANPPRPFVTNHPRRRATEMFLEIFPPKSIHGSPDAPAFFVASPSALSKPASAKNRAQCPLCSRSFVTRLVHPVWWLAPRPAPFSPWKYS